MFKTGIFDADLVMFDLLSALLATNVKFSPKIDRTLPSFNWMDSCSRKTFASSIAMFSRTVGTAMLGKISDYNNHHIMTTTCLHVQMSSL